MPYNLRHTPYPLPLKSYDLSLTTYALRLTPYADLKIIWKLKILYRNIAI